MSAVIPGVYTIFRRVRPRRLSDDVLPFGALLCSGANFILPTITA